MFLPPSGDGLPAKEGRAKEQSGQKEFLNAHCASEDSFLGQGPLDPVFHLRFPSSRINSYVPTTFSTFVRPRHTWRIVRRSPPSAPRKDPHFS